MMARRPLFLAVTCSLLCATATAFLNQQRHGSTCNPPVPGRNSRLQMAQFDISKPVFDLYSFRQVRGDALAKYSSLNQSEPLRINLSALLCLTAASSPILAPELTGGSLTLPQTGAAAVLTLAGAAAFVRESQRRSRQLTRLEKELQALDLSLRKPSSSVLADAPFSRDVLTIRQLQQQSGARIVALAGTSTQLESVLNDLNIVGRRLTQANTYVIAVPTDNPDWSFPLRTSWLAQTADVPRWVEYFQSISDSSEFKWFGLRATGRSFGSGQGQVPDWLQLMGRELRPVDLLDLTDVTATAQSNDSEVLKQHKKFYRALTEGRLEEILDVFDEEPAPEVTEVLEAGGRLDDWKMCLEDGARPEGMTVADVDVTVVNEELAYSTCVEMPALIEGATLLAVQTWKRKENEWKLAKHQTIPWGDRAAAGTLIGDKRGCVSLVRSR